MKAFDVTLGDGTVLWSKLDTGRFPNLDVSASASIVPAGHQGKQGRRLASLWHGARVARGWGCRRTIIESSILSH